MNAFHTLTMALGIAALSAPTLSAQTPRFASLDQMIGGDAGSRFGETFATLGDLNADGTPDLLIGIPSLDNHGLTAVSGATGEILYHMKRANLGMSISDLAVTGDFNQDGHDDFLATGYRYGNSGLQWVDGVAKIFSGADGSLLMTHSDGHLEDFGRRSEAIGDVNGDGFQDIGLIATPLSQSWQVRPTVIIISGQDGHEMARLSSPTPQGLVLTLGGIGDTNNDGRDEFLIGVPQDWFAQSTYFGQAQVMTLLN